MEESSTPDFQVLDEMLSMGKISQTMFTKLKDGFKHLHDTLKSAHSSEMHVLEEAQRCRAELEQIQVKVQSLEEQQSPSEEPDGEVSKLRRQLLQAYNELKAAEERGHTAQHDLQRLWEEKQYLEKEIQTQPADMESNTNLLKGKLDVLKNEVAQRQQDVRKLIEDLETLETLLLKEQNELEENKMIIKIKEAEKAQLACIPNQIMRDIERKRSVWKVAMKRMESLNMELSETKHQMRSVSEGNQSLEMRRQEAMQEPEQLRAQIEACQKENRRLLKEQEISREEFAEIMGSSGILEMKLQNLMIDRKQLCNSQSVQLRKKHRQVEALRRMEQAVAMATEQLEFTQSTYKQIQVQLLDAVPEREASARHRRELEREMDALKASFEKQVSVAEEETQRKQHYRIIQELLTESNHLREELHNLSCLRLIKAEERGKQHKERLKAQQLSERIQQELKEKELLIIDHNKLNMLLQHRVSQYAKLYNQFKEEKNKYVRLKQIASQTISDLGEQLNILGNEMEIQRSIADSKDRLLTKARINVSNGSKTRERLCNEISKFTCKRHQISQKYEDNKLELTNLSQMIEFQQNTLLELKKGLEKASQRRIILGIQLLEQEKVLLNYSEQTKNLEAAITNRNMAMETMETDMRELKIKINEEKRQIDLKKGDRILKRKIEEEITMLQIELSEARKKTLKSVNCTLEYRELRGEDLPTSELVKKMKQLEVNLAKRESQLLEKELLVELVTQLSKSLREQAESCRLHSLSVAKKLNETRTNMININLSLMAASAEFSMKKAVVLSEQQQIKEKVLQFSEARKRMLKSENCTLEFRESKVENLLTSELGEKMEELEVNVAERESQLLEKGLLEEQVTQLSEPPGEQAESCRLPSLSVAKKMDKCQWEAGQEMPPYLNIEEGYRRMLRDKKRRQREKEEKKLAEESKWRLLPNGVYTTAEARPNAYIPENDPLGLPKPFGRFPPIKPCPKGAYMRHYRNPTIRPWEI